MRRVNYLMFIVALLLVLSNSIPNSCVEECTEGTKSFLGECVPAQYLPVSCGYNGDCSSGDICISGYCEIPAPKPCVPSCKSGETCTNGKCNPQICRMFCMMGFHCENGKCVSDTPVDKCAGVNCCPPGSTCRNGLCYPNPVKLCRMMCMNGFHCQNGQCVPDTPVDKCAAVLCSADSTCKDGICIPNPVKGCTKLCVKGTYCVNNQCVPIPRTCDCNVEQQCIKGVCQNPCKSVLCPKEKICIKGKCQPTKCGLVDCPSGTYCKNGKCVPNNFVCPGYPTFEAKVCTDPRPNESNCPTIYYITAPDPVSNFCGVLADGRRGDFGEQCYVCKNPDVVYYFTKPCFQSPFVCSPGDMCKGYYCSSPCNTSEECPYDWQACSAGRCIDRCDIIRCARGTCKYGDCNYEEPSGSCSYGEISGCRKDTWSCIGHKCADLCTHQACPPNHTCEPKRGGCIPNP